MIPSAVLQPTHSSPRTHPHVFAVALYWVAQQSGSWSAWGESLTERLEAHGARVAHPLPGEPWSVPALCGLAQLWPLRSNWPGTPDAVNRLPNHWGAGQGFWKAFARGDTRVMVAPVNEALSR